jgi:MFS family permease
MIFSGHFVDAECPSCGFTRGRKTPTSILFFLLLAAAGAGLLLPVLKNVFGWRWWYLIAIPAGELVLPFLLLSLLAGLQELLFPLPKRCPSCSAEMEAGSCYWYDFGCLPTLLEVLVCGLHLVGHIVAILWIAGGAGRLGSALLAVLGFLVTAVILATGATLFAVVYEGIAGNESFSLPFMSILGVAILGAILHLIWGWIAAAIVLGLYGVYCVVGGLLDRR